MSRASLIVALALGAAPAFAQGDDPVETLKALEARVMKARRVTIEASIDASGALPAQLTGKLQFDERNRATESWQGQLRGAPVTLSLASDGRVLDMKAGELSRSERVARESNRALLAGALRTGLLHNLLRLQLLQPPDHAGGGVEAWTSAEGFRPTTYGMEGDLRGAVSFGYDLMLDGANTASVRVWLDPVTGLPRRQQFVLHGADGETTVTEDYRRFTLDQ